MQHRRNGALAGVAILLALSACGSGSDAATQPDEPAPATRAPAGTDSVGTDSSDDEAPESDEEPADAPETESGSESGDLKDEATAAAIEPEGEQPDVTEVDPVDEQPDDTEVDPPSEEAPPEPASAEAAAPAEPVVGGRLFAPDVQPAAQFDANPFPDLVVNDIGKDAQVNIKNILPSDRPVLLWAWAPH